MLSADGEQQRRHIAAGENRFSGLMLHAPILQISGYSVAELMNLELTCTNAVTGCNKHTATTMYQRLLDTDT